MRGTKYTRVLEKGREGDSKYLLEGYGERSKGKAFPLQAWAGP